MWDRGSSRWEKKRDCSFLNVARPMFLSRRSVTAAQGELMISRAGRSCESFNYLETVKTRILYVDFGPLIASWTGLFRRSERDPNICLSAARLLVNRPEPMVAAVAAAASIVISVEHLQRHATALNGREDDVFDPDEEIAEPIPLGSGFCNAAE